MIPVKARWQIFDGPGMFRWEQPHHYISPGIDNQAFPAVIRSDGDICAGLGPNPDRSGVMITSGMAVVPVH